MVCLVFQQIAKVAPGNIIKWKRGTLSKNNDADDLCKKMIYCIKNYNLAIKNNISKKYLNRFLMSDRSKDYEKLLTKFEN